MTLRRPILIDTDTASDDAVALMMALRSPLVKVVAITTVSGNVPLGQATSNALYTVELCGSAVAVYAGAGAPLARPLEDATWFHGLDGLGDHGFQSSRSRIESLHAADAIVESVHANPGLELITLGPLTNLAIALRKDPSIAGSIQRCVIMGGAPCCEGNVTPAAEFNIWVDPEAAQIVFQSALAIELVGWHLSRDSAVLNNNDIARIEALATPLAEFAVRSNSKAAEAYFKQTGERGIALPDPVAMSILLDPALCTSHSLHYVAVESDSPLTRGMTVVDRLGVAEDIRNCSAWAGTLKNANKCRICWKLDVPGFKELLFQALMPEVPYP